MRKSTPARDLISPTCKLKIIPLVKRGRLSLVCATHVTERGTHDNGLVSVLLVVVEDLLHRLNTWISVALEVLPCSLLVPVKDLKEGIQNERLYVKQMNSEEQVRTRPTKGEMRVTPASAQATACPKPKRRVRLQWIPSSRSSSRAAWIPSHVDAILISIRSFLIPTES